MARRRTKGAGSVRQLPSRRWQASYVDDDGTRRNAPTTFDTKADATAWLKHWADGTLLTEELPTSARMMPSLDEYWAQFITHRQLRPRTKYLYGQQYAVISETFGDVELNRITPTNVRNWYTDLLPHAPTKRAHVYSLLRTILNAAIADDLIATNPCRVRGAGSTSTARDISVATPLELDAIVDAMPARLRAAVLLSAWCGLRRGEIMALQRSDLQLAKDNTAGTVHVRRGLVRMPGEYVVGEPKTRAGRRTVAIPPHLIPVLKQHLDEYVQPSADSWVFTTTTGQHLNEDSLRRPFKVAVTSIGRPNLRFHDLRHTGATMAAAAGATLADLMTRMGHTTPQMAMHYQHMVADRDANVAAALSSFAEDKVIPLRGRKRA